MDKKNSVTLIGMPASGKSTIGVLLAKTLGFSFVDTDLIIQKNSGSLLQAIIDEKGILEFLKLEEKALLSLTDFERTVIATGGSAVFSEKGMMRLKEKTVFVYLKASPEVIRQRLVNIKTRGIAAEKGNTLDDIFTQRKHLYESYADFSVEVNGESMEKIVEDIIKNLNFENQKT